MSGSLEEQALVTQLPVSVVMERRKIADSPWVSETWSAIGVTVGRGPAAAGDEPITLIEGAQAAQYLWTGLQVELFRDEAESYYHNLTVDSPGCFVVIRPREDGTPRPVLVTVSFDVAQAYQEGGDTVHSVPLPPELYRACEAFVLTHYVPERKKKRKLDNWREGHHDGH
jgi:hypothetical protein